ncbi:hypothetical protein H8B15_18925 [Hymenobacter sp. BT507]|uniref:Uncharacterized protein n=1 Tax=Hymenobacter citatus TaxID=2763506 RepID=A0ABR7MR21_9BACT|nr:hypothetical protein [Hymenobacter citatus]MBC6613003.1 hypothetical protein [Hymenobacter citatus]
MSATHHFRPRRLAEQLEQGPTQRPPQPPSPPRRRTPFPAPVPDRPFRAVLLYRLETLPYLANLGGPDKEYRLVAECLPTAEGTAVHDVLFLCPPQPRYAGQCDAILQTRCIERRKDLHSGLRTVEKMPARLSPWVDCLFVGDYKTDYREKVLGPAAVVLMRRATATEPAYLLLLVTEKAYQPKSRSTNAQTARNTLQTVLPQLPEWLKLLPSELE